MEIIMKEISLDLVEEHIDKDPLLAVDLIFQALSAKKQSNSKKLMDLLAEAILMRFEKPIYDDYVNALFDQSLSHRERRFIGVCLLRILSFDDKYLEYNPKIRAKALSLMDDVFKDDIYKELKITPKDQTYEKIRKLKDVVLDAEKRMRDIIESLRSLERLSDFREQYMRTLGNPINKAIMRPFLPNSLLHKTRVNELFDVVRDYYQASASNIIETYENAKRVINQYLEEAKECKTIYCQQFLVNFADKLLNLLEEDFNFKDIAQPAELEVRPVNKKYPFHQLNKEVNVKFEIINKGPGYAFNVEIYASTLFDNIVFKKNSQHLGHLKPGFVTVDFPVLINTAEEISFVDVKILWSNADGTQNKISEEFELEGQRTDINWEELSYQDPYSLEPVETFKELVGRKEIIEDLIRIARAKSIGSSYIYGQKRVGKTSIAKALKSRLAEFGNFLVIYMESGEYLSPDPVATLNNLGNRLCQKIKKNNNKFKHLTIPTFNGALNPLVDFLENVHEINHDLRIMFILDEFDEIPIELFRRGPLADAFFQTIRTISGKPYCGFVLVGGEKIDFIKSCQGDTFNKFTQIPVDYFDREQHWSDFQELVRRPTQDWLEITDDAIVAIYEQTAGNPYFTMCICREIFSLALRKRDYFITKSEVTEEAVPLALKHIGTGFYHFWEDGIFETTGDRVEEVSIRRRKILLALANILRKKNKAKFDDIANQDIVCTELDGTTLESELRRFVQRRILVEENGLYDCKIPLFRKWLEQYGVKDILTTFTDLDAILERRKKEEEAYVKSDEIIEMISNWGFYQGRRVTEDKVRAWLEQFGDYFNQRLMFKILQGLKFYSEDLIRSKMKEAHGIVKRGLIRRIESGKRKRDDIIISYIDSPGKSGGGRYAKLYADENGIYYENVVERSKLGDVIHGNPNIQAIVFIDDFIGTGSSVQGYFEKLVTEYEKVLKESDLKIFFIAITGFQEGQKKIEELLEKYKLPVEIHICDPLDDSAKCFSDSSVIFPNEGERSMAKQIAYDYGVKLVKNNPLGYGECQSAIIFSDSCPNNNLPILWMESKNPPWKPLFKRPLPSKQNF